MASTYDPIATTTLGSTSGTITFSSIPSTYTDLRLVLIAVSGSLTTSVKIRFNNDSSAIYGYTGIGGDGTTAVINGFYADTNIQLNYSLAPGTTIPGFFTVDVFSYAGSTYKPCLITESLDQNGTGETFTQAGIYASTSAINRIDLLANARLFGIGTTATLYGIKAA